MCGPLDLGFTPECAAQAVITVVRFVAALFFFFVAVLLLAFSRTAAAGVSAVVGIGLLGEPGPAALAAAAGVAAWLGMQQRILPALLVLLVGFLIYVNVGIW